MRSRREWHKTRSSHARVLEALEASVAAHPASGRREQGRPDTGRPEHAKVLRLVPRPDTPIEPDAA